jgi:PqqD family protein of HPr-rel-A system
MSQLRTSRQTPTLAVPPQIDPVLNTTHLGELAISDGGFVFDPRTGHSYNLNETALATLRALKDGAEPDAIIAKLRDQFAVEHDEDVARDVGDLISRLRELGLVS